MDLEIYPLPARNIGTGFWNAFRGFVAYELPY